ncbi:pentatricopeptide repeat-containing protein At5g50280, chloroplastic [Syzygium oleosum]|uniref:pentatricopeptide repeat-containing protein At5g50280, chloroplastic n=1 Tax=Syzygium oleosum TaxID=219896 RepID=UPI0024B901F2|nr:pentatricopeptide repeat-containing protein At5g50280, chloroplastic [Syzygium oleosum]
MALTNQRLPFPLLLLPPPHGHSTRSYSVAGGISPAFKPLSLSATSPSSSSHSPTSSIFLPHLQQHDQQQQEQRRRRRPQVLPQSQPRQEPPPEDDGDPILRFFKSRTPAQDPPREGRLSLQNKRRSSWRLAPGSVADSEAEDASVPAIGDAGKMGSSGSASKALPEGVVGEILKLARNLPVNTTLGELLGGFQGKIGAKECVEVLGFMEKEGLVKSSIYFFEWMGLQEPSLVTSRACSVMFPMLGRARMGNKLLVLFENLPNKIEFRDVRVYNSAISGLMSSGSYKDAWKVYEAMEANNVQPDHVTCSIVITVMRKNGHSAKESWEFFERMNRKGVKWSSEVMGALIKSFCDEGLKKEALIIQAEMEKKGIPSNVIVYNTFMDAYGKSNQIEEAEGLFAEMKAKGLKPTAATFNILMDAYSRRMQPEIVEKFLKDMQEMGLEPNATSYTCLISAYGRQRTMSDMAADAFMRMRRVGVKPNLHSYTALVHAYSVSGWHEKAYTAFEDMLREGIKPSIETYTTLLDAFRRAGDIEVLMKIWKMMITEKVEGTQVTFNILLDGFAKQGHYIEARDVISEFGKIGLQPTVMTYNMLINAYARGGQHLKLPQLLKEMAALNLKPDSITYSTMIYAFVRVRDFRRAFFYHKKMVKSGQVPDARSYQKLREILDVKAAIKNRKDRSAILGIVNSKMGSVRPKKKRKKDEFWKNRIRHRRVLDGH